MSAVVGGALPTDSASEYNAIAFIVEQTLGGDHHCDLVQLKSVAGNRVSVQPLTNQVDGLGNATPNGIVNNLIYFGLQGGQSAIQMPPVVGDIGIALFADRDISSVIANAGPANPGSFRRFSMSDGIYFGGVWGLNGAPTQFIQFQPSAGGITITTPGPLTINASGVTHNGTNIGATHKHLYTPGTGAPTETGPPNE